MYWHRVRSVIKNGLHLQDAGQAVLNSEELGFLDCFGGALLGAGTAADADIGIDDVLVFALRDSLNGALLGAGAALDASIGNVISHDMLPPCGIYFCAPKGGRTFILAWILKKAIPFSKNSYISKLPWQEFSGKGGSYAIPHHDE
jgi:hypothetical protein